MSTIPYSDEGSYLCVSEDAGQGLVLELLDDCDLALTFEELFQDFIGAGWSLSYSRDFVIIHCDGVPYYRPLRGLVGSLKHGSRFTRGMP